MMIAATSHITDRSLAPVSARFALSQAELSTSEEAPSGATSRPFALRFARTPNRAVHVALPPHRYCHVRQVTVTDDDAATPVANWTPTTLATKDGQGNPQEDWKPDFPFHES